MISYKRQGPKRPPAPAPTPINYNKPGRAPITKMSPLGSENSIRLSAARPTVVIVP